MDTITDHSSTPAVIIAPRKPGERLLDELRGLAGGCVIGIAPVTLMAVPRWAALALARAAAAERGERLREGHADALRQVTKAGRPNGPQIVLWLPVSDHPAGGCFVCCHAAYEAAIVHAWRQPHAPMWPRSFTEALGVPLAPWRSDQDAWRDNPATVQKNMLELLKDIARHSRRPLAHMMPSEALSEIIREAQPQEDAGAE
jgi:hypothetical protein